MFSNRTASVFIERNGAKYINEPHAGGGNPVLAIGGKDTEATETIFTDMLGTSLGKIEENRYSAIAKTSFGADTSDKLSFFTGKPYIEDLVMRSFCATTAPTWANGKSAT